MLQSKIIILVTSFILINGEKDYPHVKTPLGEIRGYYKRSENNRLYEAYEGIPYASRPVGLLRFQAPQKIRPWVGELQATKASDFCIQFYHVTRVEIDRVGGSEDCLYLNIYVPVQESPLPVIVWIHGGAFQFGSGSDFGARYLADKDMILVTINYRLGALGFLSTEDEIVPGNMGLKDQSMALRWVNENIMSFGGDPDKITLVGVSAGGVSVHYHYLSPLSVGLFQNGISMSGTALVSWGQTENSLEKAQKLAALMGCPTNTTKDMVECLRSRPVRPLVQATIEFQPWLYNPFTPFGPVVEKSQNGYFINQSPAEIITNGGAYDVPWITGVVSEEGLYPGADFITLDSRLNDLNDNWNKIAPFLLDYNYTLPQEIHAEVAQKIRNHYLGSKDINKETVKPLIQLLGDRLFVVDAEKAARLQAKHNTNPVWFYYYNCKASGSLSRTLSLSKANFGVSHADDAFLVFEQSTIKYKSTAHDRAIREYLMNFWTLVASNGKPDLQEWDPVKPLQEEFNYLRITGPKRTMMEYNSNLGEKEFWNSINFNENKYQDSPEFVEESEVHSNTE